MTRTLCEVKSEAWVTDKISRYILNFNNSLSHPLVPSKLVNRTSSSEESQHGRQDPVQNRLLPLFLLNEHVIRRVINTPRRSISDSGVANVSALLLQRQPFFCKQRLRLPFSVNSLLQIVATPRLIFGASSEDILAKREAVVPQAKECGTRSRDLGPRNDT